MKVGGSSIEVALTPHCGSEDILTGTAYMEESGTDRFSYLSQNSLAVVETNWVSVENNIIMAPEIFLCPLRGQGFLLLLLLLLRGGC